MKGKFLVFVITFIVCSNILNAQKFRDRPFSNADSLLVDVERFFTKGTGEEAVVDSLFSAFESEYSSLDPEKQLLIYKISLAMFSKGYRVNPHLKDFYRCIVASFGYRNLSESEFSNFLNITDTTVNYYKGSVLSNFLKTTRCFLENDTIYTSRYNSLIIEGGNFTFDHIIDEDAIEKGAGFETATASTEPLIEEVDPDKKDWFEGMPDEESEDEDEWVSDDTDDWEDDDDGWGSDDDDWSDDEDDDWGDEGDDWSEEETTEIEEKSLLGDSFSSESLFSIPDPELPDELGPILRIENANFVLNSIYDSTKIENVSGALILKNGDIVGKKGRFTWENVGFSPDEVYSDLGAFTMNLKEPKIKADTAKLAYKTKLEEPITGVFEYNSNIHNRKPEKAKYPKFQSYYSNHVLNDILEGVTYKGGIHLRGKRLRSDAAIPGEAMVRFEGEKGKYTSKTKKWFSLDDSSFYSPQASLVIHYSEEDSLSHPAVIFRYNGKNSILEARRDKSEFKTTLFVDTRNDVNISAEFLTWNTQKDSLDMSILNARDRIPLVVESKDYFDKYRFIALKGSYNFHPLQMVVGYATKTKQSVFYSADMAKALKQSPVIVKGAMIELSKRDYIEYNQPSDLITLKRQALLYVYAMNGKKGVDYDNMIMHSRTSNKPNLSISLNSNNFNLEGVNSFMISDSMKVLVTPKDGKVNLKDGRNTSFGGEMRAGNFVFRGPEFIYNYDSFNVRLDVIDSISILVTHKDGVKKELANNIVNTGGILYISHPKNKSGRKNMTQYPILDAIKGGAIYFDGKEILNGSYDHRVRFEIPPFVIDSLNDNNTDVIAFDGTFKTEGIFPDFEEQISIQPDYSFGFERQMDPNGVPLYNGKGKFYNAITLNNKGIRGEGRIEYLTGNFQSKDFIFYSDSVLTTGEDGEITEKNETGASYPSVKLAQYSMRWLVDNDSMLLTSEEDTNFEIYNPEITFKGTLALTNTNVDGNGIIETPRSLNESKNFYFESNKYTSTNSTFNIKSEDPKTPAMLGEHIEVKYDLEKGEALAKSEREGENSFTFPFVKYETNISQVLWEFEANQLVMSVDGTNKDGLGKFISEKSDQDSLEINASTAIYDLNNHVLNLEGVPDIIVANIRIIPDSGKVFIRENAEMDELLGATIELNKDTKNYTLTDANIKIVSKNKFQGEGYYNYSLGIKDTFKIKFEDFDVKKDEDEASGFVTTARSAIMEDDNFVFAPGVKFKGDLILSDNKSYMTFKGAASLDIDREDNEWFTYNSGEEGTHGNIFVDENLKVDGFPTKLSTGLYLGKFERNLYSSLIQFRKERANDNPIFIGRGNLTYNEETKDYTIAHEEKLSDPNFTGNLFIYNHETQQTQFEGKFSFVEPSNKFTVRASGKGKGEMDNEAYDINTMLYIEFDPGNAMFDIPGVDLDEGLEESVIEGDDIDILVNKLSQLLTEKQLGDFIYKFEDGNEAYSDFFNNGITLTNIDLKWSSDYAAFYSEGDIEIGNIFKTDLNKISKGYVEIPKSEADHIINIFIMEDPELWYFLHFEKSGIRALSSNGAFNATLNSKSTGNDIGRANNEELLGFVSSFRMNYLGIEELLDLVIPQDENIEIPTEAIESDVFGDDVFGDDVSEDAPLGEDPVTEEGEEEEEEDDDDGF
ncbi:MAG: hypothetical protein KTR26_15420 [Flammeovirgaceae bacterium]|nr:hypothetical protein [Flammeovirgaceae bacterium]